ncbi:Acetolactate synthase large subunit [Sporomusa sphaeroides DSM 2875]|uniref:Acetolactate synthase n=2 Tax=Sporomusa TaxID=2375 RepID=A0ABP2C9W3_9FIRM|nr:biosynthetic-type acetolactate synthase large subunit [Sporomusa sphaeroides]OLS56088.1 acetolactate synthase large subunit [Sporomusa sphaeroides DSM 2875]CVK19270.1 Acetolactate synthase large subunit [Sporomusa sphaeroides DSM 2875]
MHMTGAQAIVKCLVREGVDTVFGYPGGTILPLYDALYGSPVRHVLTVHEQGAAHAADGYARASGRAGVCIATSGPGATNLVTGLAAAFMDSIPVVAITGQVQTSLIGRDAFQEIDITGITMPITKHNFLVKDSGKLIETLRRAFAIARSGRPGPVLVDIPRDIQSNTYDFIEFDSEYQRQTLVRQSPDLPELIAKAAAAVSAAERPVIIAGGGCISANAAGTLAQFAEQCRLPVVTTLMGIGALPGTHPNHLGLTGLHGLKSANQAVHEADVLIVTGSRFNDRVTGDRASYAAGKTIIHIDIDPAEVHKNVDATVPLVGEMNAILTGICQAVKPAERPAWWETIRKWQAMYRETAAGAAFTAEEIMGELNRQLGDKGVIYVTDVGQHQMWAAQKLSVNSPRGFLTSGGLGAMGFGLPAAVGAQLARPDKRVVHIVGDGALKMTGCELYTVTAEGLPIISIVINNHSLGMVRQLQHCFYEQRYSASLLPTPMDFSAFAAAFGIPAAVTNCREEFSQAVAAAWERPGPSLIVANIATDDLVTPMIAPGGTMDAYVEVK